MKALESRLPRRAALRRIVASALSPWIVGATGSTPPEPRPVLIVGAGVSGLLLAHRLRQQDRSFRILEASDRVGGRILTLREGLASGLRAEAGAERVPSAHARTRALAQELQLRWTSYPDLTTPSRLRVGDHEQRFQDFSELSPHVFEGLSDFERAAAPLDIALAYAEAHPALPEDDPRNALQWLRSLGLSRRGQALVEAFCHFPLSEMSAASFHALAQREREHWDGELLDGGNDRLCEALAEGLRPFLVHGVEIVEVGQDEAGVRLKDRQGRTHEGSAAAFCLPLEPLRRLRFDDASAESLRPRLAALRSIPEVKVHWEVPRARIEDGTLCDAAFQDRFPRVCWELPERADGHSVHNAIAVKRASCQELAAAPSLREHLALGAPELSRLARSVHCHDFHRDPLAGGAYTVPRPGQPLPREDALRIGRLHFAGADLSTKPGWIEGAVRSAEEVCRRLTA